VPQPLTTLDRSKSEIDHHAPKILPGGRALLLTAHQGDDGRRAQTARAINGIISVPNGTRSINGVVTRLLVGSGGYAVDASCAGTITFDGPARRSICSSRRRPTSSG
jgi:hypothetical protein